MAFPPSHKLRILASISILTILDENEMLGFLTEEEEEENEV